MKQETPQAPPVRQRGRTEMRPAKKRRLIIDREIRLSGDFIRANLANPSSTLKQVVR